MARLHIFVAEAAGEDTEVWIDTNDGEKDGLCIGVGKGVRSALKDARRSMESVVLALMEAD